MEIILKPLKKDNLRFLLLVRNGESTRTQLKNDVSFTLDECEDWFEKLEPSWLMIFNENSEEVGYLRIDGDLICLLYTSPSPRDATLSRMPSSA